MSRFNIQERRFAAEVFCTTEATAVQKTRQLVQDSAKKLLLKVGHKILTRTELAEAFNCLEQNKLGILFSLLRNKAASFVTKGLSGAFWSWIDAFGFFSDATGVNWPYMTDSGRKSSLAHAQECAEEALVALS